jgi:hypothetical protein
LASSVSSTFGLPTGSIQFKLGTTILATVPVTGTTAKFTYTPSKSGMGAFTATYLGSTNFATSSTNASLQFRARDPIFIVASQAGSTFMTYNAKTGKQISVFQPLGPTYTGGFRVAKGDVNGDGYADFAYTTNTGSFVRVINLAIGDINGDGRGDIIVAPGGSGFGPRVRAFSGANYATVLFDKNVYSTSFVSGVSVASADVNGDGKHDIVCAPMAGAGPNVVVYSGATGTLLNSINAIATGNKSGFSVTADDLTGDGKAEIMAPHFSQEIHSCPSAPHSRVVRGLPPLKISMAMAFATLWLPAAPMVILWSAASAARTHARSIHSLPTLPRTLRATRDCSLPDALPGS